jgi:murein DD-endopeptidase MepM/ murein hydrolase activator NlpD
MEILPGEENNPVPVYAIGSGTVTFVGPVAGYGGVILEKLASDSFTVLYGHVNYLASSIKVGDQVAGGRQLTILGNAFSSQTGGERKHLHLGLYKGSGEYFRGYEATMAGLTDHWLDPLVFLAGKNAVEIP